MSDRPFAGTQSSRVSALGGDGLKDEKQRAIGVQLSRPLEKSVRGDLTKGAYLLRKNCTETDPAKMCRWCMQLAKAEVKLMDVAVLLAHSVFRLPSRSKTMRDGTKKTARTYRRLLKTVLPAIFHESAWTKSTRGLSPPRKATPSPNPPPHPSPKPVSEA